jgi:Spy/CpxP family protein refolding chaperone
MQILYFTLGWFTALVLMAIVLVVIYSRLKRTRKGLSNIKGYLDLIPDLSLDQRNRLQEIRSVFSPKVSDIRKKLYIKRSELADLLFAEPFDRPKLDNTAKEILRHQSELENEVIEHILEEKELLSPTQKRKFYEIIIEQFSHGGLGVHDVKGRKT